MSETDNPQLYLITPKAFGLSEMTAQLTACLDAAEIACVRLQLASSDADDWARAADAVRPITHERDIPLVIDTHINLVTPHGLDGVHLPDGARSVAKARKALNDDAVVGAFCTNSSHDGMTAGEIGADYISFGPAGNTQLGTQEPAEHDLFAWWSQMIELPVVAEGALSDDVIAKLKDVTDFFAIGDEIWSHEDPVARLKAIASLVR